MKQLFSNPTVRLALISVLLALLITFVFLLPRNPGAYRAVPAQTSLLLEFNGLVRAAQQLQQITDNTWKAVAKNIMLQHCLLEIGATEALFHHQNTPRTAFAQGKILAAFSLHPADSLQALFILEMEQPINLKDALASNTHSKKFFPYQFHRQTLYTVYLSPHKRVIVAQKGRLLIFSRYSYLVEDALTQMESAGGWWANNQYLNDLNDQAAIRLLLRPSKWEAQNSSSVQQDARVIPSVLSQNVAWIGLAWDGQKTSALCEATGFLAKTGSWNGVKRGDLFSLLPDNTAFVAWAGFDNSALFFEQFGNRQSADFDRYVLPWIGQESAVVVTEPLSAALTDDRLLLLAVRDSAKTRKALEDFGKTRGLLSHDQTGMFDIYGFQSQSLLEPFLSPKDKAFQNPYLAHLGSYVVVAPNRPAMEVFLEKYIGNQTLAQNTDFLQMAQRLSPKGRGLLLLNGGYLTRLLSQLFQEPIQDSQLKNDLSHLSQAGWMAAELTPTIGRKVAVALDHQVQTQQLPISNVFWKTGLVAPTVTPVFGFQQPDGPALLVQDKKTELYCLSAEGAIRWQKHLGNYIISSIYGIDFYQNGQKCFLFNTKTQVWLIDENGKELPGYPLSLKASATTGLSVVDFEKNLKFSYFVCCDNGNVYGFDLYGRAIDGWNPQPNVGKTVGSIVHFQQKGKDYLAVLNNQGVLSVFGRDGKLRFPAAQLPGTYVTPPVVYKSKLAAQFFCINSDGLIISFDANGKYQTQQWDGKKGNAVIKAISLEWQNGTALAITQANHLDVLQERNNTWKSTFSKQFGEPQDDVFPTEFGIGFCARGKRKIMMLDKTGKMVVGFPLAGNTAFSICQTGPQSLLVVGNGSAVYAYKL